MNRPLPKESLTRRSPLIVVASDRIPDATVVKRLLEAEFDRVLTVTEEDRAVIEFDQHGPDVLVLAFNSLAKSEQYYLGLYRQSSRIHAHPHRTVVLCHKDEIRHAFELCRKELFDDYVLFWPMNHDALRLPMTVYRGWRELTARQEEGPSAAEFAAQARRLVELESLLERHVAEGGARIAKAGHAVSQAEEEIDAALDAFMRRMAGGDPGHPGNKDGFALLVREMDQLKKDVVRQRFHHVAESVQPVKQWAENFRQEYAPHVESARILGQLADRIRPVVLVVDDDEFLRKAVGKILEGRNCQPLFAVSGVEALHLLHRTRPDLILLDVMMPDLDGIEVLRRVKAAPELASIPVVMITGKSEGRVVIDSLKAGASDFVVKPFDRNTLLTKVSVFL